MRIALARPPLALLTRTPRAWASVTAWTALGVAFAAAARSRGFAHGADHVLIGAFGALVLPLLTYSLVGAVLGGRSLPAAGVSMVAFGATPGRAAVATMAIGVLAATAACAVLAAIVALIAHGSADPPVARDAVESAYAGALGSASYAAWFFLGASFGKRGGGRPLLLVVDWVLGASGSAAAVVTPRAHLRNLLGGLGPLDMGERASALSLVAVAASCVLLALVRCQRSRWRLS